MDTLEVGLATLALLTFLFTIIYSTYLFIRAIHKTFKEDGLLGILYEIGSTILIALVMGGMFIGIIYVLGIITRILLKALT